MATTRKSRAGARKAPATPKAVAKAAPAAVAAPATAPGMVQLVTTATGTRTFHDARGLRRTVVLGESFEVDAATARILLRTDPEAFAKAGTAPASEPEPGSGPSPTTGAMSVADLGSGGVVAKVTEPSAATPPPADAAEAASSGEGDQGGTATPAEEPEASSSGEAGSPPSESDAAGAPGATVLT